jgi:hypothetical protein
MDENWTGFASRDNLPASNWAPTVEVGRLSRIKVNDSFEATPRPEITSIVEGWTTFFFLLHHQRGLERLKNSTKQPQHFKDEPKWKLIKYQE